MNENLVLSKNELTLLTDGLIALMDHYSEGARLINDADVSVIIDRKRNKILDLIKKITKINQEV